MKYKKNDIVVCKNGYEYVIEGRKNEKYVCSLLINYYDKNKLYCNIDKEAFVDVIGKVMNGCIILGGQV